MAMTLTQLERYMISEVENLHIKIDSVLELLLQQFQQLSDKFDRMEARYEARFGSLEVLIGTKHKG